MEGRGKGGREAGSVGGGYKAAVHYRESAMDFDSLSSRYPRSECKSIEEN